MIVEMRTYKTKPGRRAEFLEIFRSKSIPAHEEIGMKILGPFLSVEDPETFFFMRGFPDLASREPMKAKFYEGELWKNELEGLLMPMLEKYEVVVVEDPEHIIQWTPGDSGESLTGKRLGRPCAESLRAAGLCFGRFFFAASWRRVGFERAEKTGRDVGYFIDCGQKGGFVCLRWLIEAADLSDILERCGPDLLGSYWRVEVEEHFDVSAHGLDASLWFAVSQSLV